MHKIALPSLRNTHPHCGGGKSAELRIGERRGEQEEGGRETLRPRWGGGGGYIPHGGGCGGLGTPPALSGGDGWGDPRTEGTRQPCRERREGKQRLRGGGGLPIVATGEPAPHRTAHRPGHTTPSPPQRSAQPAPRGRSRALPPAPLPHRPRSPRTAPRRAARLAPPSPPSEAAHAVPQPGLLCCGRWNWKASRPAPPLSSPSSSSSSRLRVGNARDRGAPLSPPTSGPGTRACSGAIEMIRIKSSDGWCELRGREGRERSLLPAGAVTLRAAPLPALPQCGLFYYLFLFHWELNERFAPSERTSERRPLGYLRTRRTSHPRRAAPPTRSPQRRRPAAPLPRRLSALRPASRPHRRPARGPRTHLQTALGAVGGAEEGAGAAGSRRGAGAGGTAPRCAPARTARAEAQCAPPRRPPAPHCRPPPPRAGPAHAPPASMRAAAAGGRERECAREARPRGVV